MKIKGKAMWASVQAPNTTFEPVYQIDLIIDNSQVKSVKDLGLKVKKNDEGENVVRFKRNQFRRDGEENKRPVVVDAKNRPMTDLIGNGSLVNVQFQVYTWENKFGSGVSADLQGVQVLELVPFGSSDGSEFEPVEDDDSGEEAEAPAKRGRKAPQSTDDFDDDLPDQL